MDLAVCEDKLRELKIAEEEIILHEYTYFEGVKIEKSEKNKLDELIAMYEERIKKILKTPITVETCNRFIKLYLAAEEAVLAGQAYKIDERQLTRADLNAITRNRKYWENKKDQIEAGIKRGIKNYRVNVRDN